jgi:hypothetical protein
VRSLALLILLLAGCAQTPGKDYDRWKRELDMQSKGETPLWATIDHPVAMVYGGGGPGRFSYATKDTGSSNRREKVDANLYRLGYYGPGGLMADWMGTTEDMTGGTSASLFDLYGFADQPMWPNRRLRFQNRPGGYWQYLNLKKSERGDLEGWTLGFRYELEAEVDVIKAYRWNLSVYGSGRIGGGWGQYNTTGTGSDPGTAWGYGWEAGVRVQVSRFFGSLAWIDRTTTVEPDNSGSAEYGFSGGVLALGLRW